MAFASIAISNKCNMKCKMCEIGQRSNKSGLSHNLLNKDKLLSPEQWVKILDSLNITRLHIVAVEPLLYRQFDVQ